jgi:hypothetical protein
MALVWIRDDLAHAVVWGFTAEVDDQPASRAGLAVAMTGGLNREAAGWDEQAGCCVSRTLVVPLWRSGARWA